MKRHHKALLNLMALILLSVGSQSALATCDFFNRLYNYIASGISNYWYLPQPTTNQVDLTVSPLRASEQDRCLICLEAVTSTAVGDSIYACNSNAGPQTRRHLTHKSCLQRWHDQSNTNRRDQNYFLTMNTGVVCPYDRTGVIALSKERKPIIAYIALSAASIYGLYSLTPYFTYQTYTRLSPDNLLLNIVPFSTSNLEESNWLFNAPITWPQQHVSGTDVSLPLTQQSNNWLADLAQMLEHDPSLARYYRQSGPLFNAIQGRAHYITRQNSEVRRWMLEGSLNPQRVYTGNSGLNLDPNRQRRQEAELIGHRIHSYNNAILSIINASQDTRISDRDIGIWRGGMMREGGSLLSYAVHMQDTSATLALIFAGDNVDGNINLDAYFSRNGNPRRSTFRISHPLREAFLNNDTDLFQLLLEAGSNRQSPLQFFNFMPHNNITDLFIIRSNNTVITTLWNLSNMPRRSQFCHANLAYLARHCRRIGLDSWWYLGNSGNFNFHDGRPFIE